MAGARSARLDVRATPAQRELIEKAAAARGKSLSAWTLEVLVDAGLGDLAVGSGDGRLGWMRGTATIAADIEGPTDAAGWEPGEFPE